MYRDFQRTDSNTSGGCEAPRYVPDDTEASALLQYLSREELDDYISHPEKIDAIVKDLHQVKKIQKDRDTIVAKNKSLAEYNMSLQRPFADRKTEVGRLYEEVNKSKTGRQTHETMLAIFQTQAASSDDQSEAIADEFCGDNMTLETFLSQYVEKRTEAYIKRAKLEKVTDLLRQGSSTTNSTAPYPSTNYSPKPQPASPGYGTVNYGSAPYPSYGNVGGSMPMPSSPYR
ncbi:VP37B-like protein [Mya arenaria]|uniref:VP37B-like protein n=1 Tax=Mya arenaria TaxID=6604 RepID=A0ABY7E0T8_MYAAR|nr:VP37B-like protein [Mya arenaria]WAR02597.1 VP37B-like protein [Mya arenaria]